MHKQYRPRFTLIAIPLNICETNKKKNLGNIFVWVVSFTAQWMLLRSCQAGQLTYSHISWEGLVLWAVTHTFASNWQLPFLNQQDGDNDHRNEFIANLHGSYEAELEFELTIPGSAGRLSTHCAMEPS